MELLAEKAVTNDAARFDRDIELTCHLVLAAAGDARAAGWLQVAHSKLQGEAATIADAALRRSFLTNIPEHREIEAAWATWHGSHGEVADVG